MKWFKRDDKRIQDLEIMIGGFKLQIENLQHRNRLQTELLDDREDQIKKLIEVKITALEEWQHGMNEDYKKACKRWDDHHVKDIERAETFREFSRNHADQVERFLALITKALESR